MSTKRTKECWLFVGQNIWQRYTSEEEALKRGKRSRPAIVYHIVGDDEAYVDAFGCVTRSGESSSVEVERFPKRKTKP